MQGLGIQGLEGSVLLTFRAQGLRFSRIRFRDEEVWRSKDVRGQSQSV